MARLTYEACCNVCARCGETWHDHSNYDCREGKLRIGGWADTRCHANNLTKSGHFDDELCARCGEQQGAHSGEIRVDGIDSELHCKADRETHRVVHGWDANARWSSSGLWRK